MSMLVRKGTMLHRNPSRRSTGRRSSRGSISGKRTGKGELRATGSGPASFAANDTEGLELDRKRRASQAPGARKSASADSSPRSSGRRLSEQQHRRDYYGGNPRSSEGSVHLSPNSSQALNNGHKLEVAKRDSDEGSSRKPSACISQISGDDRRQLYRYSKFAYESQNDYGSLFTQFREASQESDSACDFSMKFFGILCKSAFVTAFFVVLSVLPLSMAFLGAKNLQECPLQPNLPVYFLVCGFFGLLKIIWAIYNQMQFRKYENFDASFFEEDVMVGTRTMRGMEWALNGFLLVWFILANIWTMELTGPGGTPPPYSPTLQEPMNWCSKSLFLFSVTHLYLVHGFLLLNLLLWIGSFAFVALRNALSK